MDSVLFDQLLLILKNDTTSTEAVLALVSDSKETVEQGFSTIALAITGVLSLLGGIFGVKLFSGSSSSGVSTQTFEAIKRQLATAQQTITNIKNELAKKVEELQLSSTKESQWRDEVASLVSKKAISDSKIKELEQNFAESDIENKVLNASNLELRSINRKSAFKIAELEEELAIEATKKAITIKEAKARLKEAVKIKGYHESTLKELGLSSISKEHIDQFLKDNPDTDDIALVNEFASWMKWTGIEQAMNDFLKNN